MTHNIGSIDKGLRIAAGLVLLGLGVFTPLGWWGLIGIVPLATGLMAVAPLTVCWASTPAQQADKAGIGSLITLRQALARWFIIDLGGEHRLSAQISFEKRRQSTSLRTKRDRHAPCI